MTALLLCGGKSTRMGVDKQKLSYNGVYLIDTIIENLAKNFDQIIILSNEKNFFENRFIIIPKKGRTQFEWIFKRNFSHCDKKRRDKRN